MAPWEQTFVLTILITKRALSPRRLTTIVEAEKVKNKAGSSSTILPCCEVTDKFKVSRKPFRIPNKGLPCLRHLQVIKEGLFFGACLNIYILLVFKCCNIYIKWNFLYWNFSPCKYDLYNLPFENCDALTQHQIPKYCLSYTFISKV